MHSLLLALVLTTAPEALVRAAVDRALDVPGGRAELLGLQSVRTGCQFTSADAVGTVLGSGRHSFRLAGRTAGGEQCEVLIFAMLKVLAPSWTLIRAVKTGEVVAASATREEREVRPGHLPVAALAPDVTAARPLPAGTVLEAGQLVGSGPVPGSEVQVVVSGRGLSLERSGRAVPCVRGHACAILPGGARIEGRWSEGRILVEAP